MKIAHVKSWLGAAVLAWCGVAAADQPHGTLRFEQPTGTVSAGAAIPVWLVLTLAADSAPLTYGNNPLAGLDLSTAPTAGGYFDADGAWQDSTLVQFTGVGMGTYYGCNENSFTTVSCGNGGGAVYTMAFNTASTPDAPSMNNLDSFSLQPGASYRYLLGEFEPVAGQAAPGTYSFDIAGLYLGYTGLDAAGHEVSSSIDIATTCGDDSCAFTRTVVAASSVPEPGGLGLLAAGLLVLGGALRRGRRA